MDSHMVAVYGLNAEYPSAQFRLHDRFVVAPDRHSHLPSSLARSVWAKTQSGRDEVASRSAGLTLRQRTVLIMLDGRTALGDLVFPVAEVELMRILEVLSELMLIENLSTRISTASHASSKLPPPSTPVDNDANSPLTPTHDNLAVAPSLPFTTLTQTVVFTESPDVIGEVKQFMIEIARKHLGLLSADLVRRIDCMDSAAQLASILGQWHMALRDTRDGQAYASEYMAVVNAKLYIA